MEIPTVAPIVLNYRLGRGATIYDSSAYLRKPNAPVDVAMSFRGMAACRAIRGVWKQVSGLEHARTSRSPYREQSAKAKGSNQGIKRLLRTFPEKSVGY
jgi:hypothetical protein